MDDLEQRVAFMITAFGPGVTEQDIARAIIPMVLEEAAKVAKTAWVSADYDIVGIADADMAMRLCEHAEAAIRAIGAP